jgi:superfamily II DNA or RNA helicase
MVLRYLDSNDEGSALIRIPTGTGKTAVIAMLACCLSKYQNVLILTSLEVLRDQMCDHLREKPWSPLKVAPDLWTKNVVTWVPSSLERVLEESKDVGTVYVSTISALEMAQSSWKQSYDKLQARITLVIVDEGHREPAPKWAEAVRNLKRPTVLLTATPYHNDYLRFFNVNHDHIYAYSHDNALSSITFAKFNFMSFRISLRPMTL